MADEQNNIEYTEEELQMIRDLTSMFDEAPGQVNIFDDDEEVEDVPIGATPDGSLSDDSAPGGADMSDLEEGLDDDPVRPQPASLQGGMDDLDQELIDLDGLEEVSEPPASAMSDDLGGLDDFGIPDGDAEETSAPAMDDLGGLDDLGISEDDTGEAPAIDDLGGLDDLGIPEGDDGESPAPSMDDFGGLDDFGAPEDDTGEAPAPAMDDLGGLDDFGAPEDDAGEAPAMDDLGGLDDFGAPEADAGGAPAVDDSGFPDSLSLDDVSPEVVLSRPSKGSDLDDLSSANLSLDDDLSSVGLGGVSASRFRPEELETFRENARRFSLPFRQTLINLLLKAGLPENKKEDLIQQVIDGKGELALKDYLQKELGEEVEAEIPAGPPKVIVTRPEYTDSGLARQARFLKLARIAAIVLFSVATVSTLGYFFIIKPMQYKSVVEKGRNLILQPGPTEKQQEAEKLFEKATQLYPEREYAFLRYADAYRERGLYSDSFEKLFGKLTFVEQGKSVYFNDMEISESSSLWRTLNKVPSVRYAPGKKKSTVLINDIPFHLDKKGAYLITHLDKKTDSGTVVMALARFHSNPSRRFLSSPYRNNRLGIDYYRRILNFKTSAPFGGKNKLKRNATLGIGDVYFNQENYSQSLEYYENIISSNPRDVGGQSGILRSLIQMAKQNDDPKLVIQQHSIIKHTLDMEDKLPMHIMTMLAAFYIDLPDDETMRIQYNLSPEDKVNLTNLRERALELLTKVRNKKEKDAFGNVKDGKTYAEGYYQRGRYYRYVEKNTLMAMKQFEYAYNFNKHHYMALNERAEILMEIHDYNAAREHLKLALPLTSPEQLSTLGDKPEDETLIKGDIARVSFNMGKVIYLTAIDSLGDTVDWFRIREASRYNTENESGMAALFSQLDSADQYFQRAEEQGLMREKDRAELNYYRGWGAYVKGNYRLALQKWESISADTQHRYPHIELARSHAYYRLAVDNAGEKEKYLQKAKGYLLYLDSLYGEKIKSYKKSIGDNPEAIELVSRLSMVENNLGAVEEMLGNEADSLQHYWRSIDYSKKMNKENEVAQVNSKLHFKREGLEEGERFPLIMDYIPPLLYEG